MPQPIISFSRAESDAFPHADGMGNVPAGNPGLTAVSTMLPLRLARWVRSSADRLVRHFEKSAPHRRMQLAVVIPLDGEAANHATKLQIEILRKYGRNPGLDACPHITLKMGFEATDIAPFEKYIGRLAGETFPLDITIRDFGSFDEGILFLDVDPNPALENLRQRILSDLAAQHGVDALTIEGPRFHFHVTLAYGLSERDFADLRKRFASERVSFRFNAKHIDLFCHTGEQWVTYKRASLREAPSKLHEIDAK